MQVILRWLLLCLRVSLSLQSVLEHMARVEYVSLQVMNKKRESRLRYCEYRLGCQERRIC